MDQEFRYFVGIDWGTENHCVVLLDREGRAIEQYNVAHSLPGSLGRLPARSPVVALAQPAHRESSTTLGSVALSPNLPGSFFADVTG